MELSPRFLALGTDHGKGLAGWAVPSVSLQACPPHADSDARKRMSKSWPRVAKEGSSPRHEGRATSDEGGTSDTGRPRCQCRTSCQTASAEPLQPPRWEGRLSKKLRGYQQILSFGLRRMTRSAFPTWRSLWAPLGVNADIRRQGTGYPGMLHQREVPCILPLRLLLHSPQCLPRFRSGTSTCAQCEMHPPCGQPRSASRHLLPTG